MNEEKFCYLITDFRAQFLSSLTGAGNSLSRGMFIDSCYAHCQAGKQITWSSNNSPVVGNTVRDPFPCSLSTYIYIYDFVGPKTFS